MKIKRAYIEITNSCNLRCSFCDTHNRIQKFMSLSQFNHIIQEIKHITPYIYLHVQGEPLSHPAFDEILNICDQEKMQVQLVTNGTFLCNHLDILNHTSLRKLSISLHSIDYQKMDVETYMQPILDFMNKVSSNPSIFLELRFWASDKLQEKAKNCLQLLERQFSKQPTNKINSYKIANNIYIHFENQFEWPSQASNENTKTGTCRGGKDMIAILVDGSVIPCCLDTQACINLGNIFNESLLEILKTSRYLNLVNGFNENKLVEPLCQQCTYRNRFTK